MYCIHYSGFWYLINENNSQNKWMVIIHGILKITQQFEKKNDTNEY